MCAIVDANAAHEVFGSSPSQAGARFFDWITNRTGHVIAGGKLLSELEQSSEDFRLWASIATVSGKLRIVSAREVDARTERILSEDACRSDDHHVIALAQVGGARLLYSNDRALHQDFRDPELVNHPRGRVFPITGSRRDQDRMLSDRRNFCAAPI